MIRGRVRPAPTPHHHTGSNHLEQAREHLARTIPWVDGGYVNIHWRTTARDGRTVWSGRAVRSLDEAVRTVQWANSLDNVLDIYACMSNQERAQEKVSQNGRPYLLPIRGQQTALALKSLFLDIDVKGNGGYENVTQAVTALGDFLTTTDMPKPTMTVASGGGLHVYWTLDSALTRQEWQPLANALARAVKENGLKADTACTVDAARILRVPDTFNRKTEPPRPVRLAGQRLPDDYTIERIKQALAQYIDQSPLPALPPRPPLPAEVNDLSAGIQLGAPPVNLDEVAQECGFIREAIDTGGQDFANPLWNLTTLISVFTTGKTLDAHRMANRHPGYTPESTEELFARKQREQEAKGLGWPACRTISNAGCAACDTCPHKDAGKSPLHFRPQTQPAAPVSDLPAGYVRNSAGFVCRPVANDDGSTQLAPVMSYKVSDAWLQSDPWVLNFKAVTHSGRPRQIAIPCVASATREGIPKALSTQGLITPEFQHKVIRDFIVSWIQTLQNTKDKVISSSPFGWQVENGKIVGFVFDGNVWMPNGARPSANPDPVIARQYAPTGDSNYWRDAARMVTDQKRPQLDVILASAFGAPLVQFTGQPGLLLSCYSMESGLGKSTAMKVAQAVWGDPIKGMQGLTDTALSVLKKIGELRSLPLYWDELKTEDDTRKFINIVFNLTSGKEKSRLNSDISMRDSGSWNTMLISASNDSLVDFVTNRTKTTTAGIYRVFEYEVHPGTQAQINPADADRIMAKLNNNHGGIGAEYAKWLGANFVQIEDDVNEMQREIVDTYKIQNDERFWRATMAVLILGARYANLLGYTNIDEAALRDFLAKLLQDMRQTRRSGGNDMRDSMNVSNVLTQYTNAMRARHTLWTNKIHIAKGKPPKGSIQVVRDASRLDGIYIHIGVDDKLMRISSTHFSHWLQELGYSRHLFTKALEQEFGSKIINGRMGSGTDFACGTEYLIEIQLAGTPLLNILDEA
jgi:hypothetical protein